MHRKLTITHPFWQVVGIGAIAGSRSMAAPAITSQILSQHHSNRLEGTPLNFLQSRGVSNALIVLAAGEFVGDKLPNTPNRIKPAGVIFRCISGAVAGAAICKATGGKTGAGAVIGAVSALASTYICFFVRQLTVKGTGIIDPVIGALEDALVIGAGIKLIKINA